MGPTCACAAWTIPSYYSLTGPEDMPRRYYMNYTGCGNSLDFNSAPVIRLVMDSLGYWVEVMRVDGFRFDLASVLGRTEDGAFNHRRPFSTLSRRIRC
jgi:glycogen operon protein